MRIALPLATALCVAASALAAQDDKPGRGGPGQEKEKKAETIKPYEELITEEAKTDAGLFKVHRIKDKIYYEIPTDILGKELLWVTQIAQTQAGHGYGGTSVGNRVVRWELRGEDVLLRDVKHRIRAQANDSVAQSVENTSLEPIIATLGVKSWGPDKAPVIEVTGLFKDDLPEFSAKRRLSASSVDKSRSFIEKTRAFPENIETKVLMTYKLGGGNNSAPTRGRRGRGARRDPSQGGVTVMLHHSMVRLPEQPMTPRMHDERVGFFSVNFEDYASDEHGVERVRYITRWRLEKKNPDAEVSDPIKPIAFYLGRGIPDKWRPFVRQGIEAWQPAFEKAGISNAIIAKDPPSIAEDPDWDAEDARYSTIRWMPSTVENAMGPHVHDPRSGEILESDIIMYHNVLKLARDWYFVQASPMDPRAQQLPMPDDLVGELLAYVVSHEVGHTLGFPHNMKASNSYSVEQLRSAEFTARFGTEASIMDYGRFNYVAQPGDGARLIPIIGPYDEFAVNWGYRQFDAVANSENDKKHLAALIAKQVEDPTLRFGNANPSEDPSQQTEDLGSDPILATSMGMKNIDRVASYLVKATCKPGEDYSLLDNMYEQLVRQRDRELGHVANVIGGVHRKNLWFGDADRVFHPETKAQQKEAMEFLQEHAFKTPEQLLDKDILFRLEASGAADRILNGQRRLLRSMVSDQRIKRMAENAAFTPEDAYLPNEMMADLRAGLWSELEGEDFSISLYRRNLQRAHIDILSDQINNEDSSTDLPALSRGDLESLLDLIGRKGSAASDNMTWMHLEDMRARILRALDPKAQPRTLDPADAAARRRR
ncbi:MAG: zinc-dependent metalloprotease [Planctomycetota bacterium]|jgi:hypothetical protein